MNARNFLQFEFVSSENIAYQTNSKTPKVAFEPTDFKQTYKAFPCSSSSGLKKTSAQL